MATLTRLGPDTPSIMEKGNKELEDTLAIERKKVRPMPPLPSQPAAHRPRRHHRGRAPPRDSPPPALVHPRRPAPTIQFCGALSCDASSPVTG